MERLGSGECYHWCIKHGRLANCPNSEDREVKLHVIIFKSGQSILFIAQIDAGTGPRDVPYTYGIMIILKQYFSTFSFRFSITAFLTRWIYLQMGMVNAELRHELQGSSSGHWRSNLSSDLSPVSYYWAPHCALLTSWPAEKIISNSRHVRSNRTPAFLQNKLSSA